MHLKTALIKYLQKNPSSNYSILNFPENYPIRAIEKLGNSVVVKETSDHDWVYIGSSSITELKMIKSNLSSQDRNFAIIEDWMIPILYERHELKWISNEMVSAQNGAISSKLPSYLTAQHPRC